MQSLCLGTGRMRRFDHPVSGGYFWYLVFGSHKFRHSPDLAEVAGCVTAKSRENCCSLCVSEPAECVVSTAPSLVAIFGISFLGAISSVTVRIWPKSRAT